MNGRRQETGGVDMIRGKKGRERQRKEGFEKERGDRDNSLNPRVGYVLVNSQPVRRLTERQARITSPHDNIIFRQMEIKFYNSQPKIVCNGILRINTKFIHQAFI